VLGIHRRFRDRERRMTEPLVAATPSRPPWLKARLPIGETYEALRADVRAAGLNTVCEEARCPNLGECWGRGTATIMILGETCTRACRFCNVKTGSAHGDVDWAEPMRVAAAVTKLGWRYLVVTSVDRDDLADGGAAIFASTIRAIRRASGAKVEVLTGDFAGDAAALDVVLAAEPDVFAHNLETVDRLQLTVRDRRATTARSLAVLERAHRSGRVRFTKTSLMVGLGETEPEVLATMDAARAAGVDIFTLGQYLRPSARHLPVVEYVTPQAFERMRVAGVRRGFRHVVASPLSRSSYHAEGAFPG